MELWKAVVIVVLFFAFTVFVVWMLWVIEESLFNDPSMVRHMKQIDGEDDDEHADARPANVKASDIKLIQATLQQNSQLAQEAARRLHAMVKQSNLDAQAVTTFQTLATKLDSITQQNIELEAEVLKYISRA